MHRIDAEIARARLAHDRVEIRPIAIKIGPGLMDHGGNFDHILLKQPACVRIGKHDRGDVWPELALNLNRIDCAVGARRNRPHLESSTAAEAGLVPCADSGTRTILRASASPLATIAALITIMPQASPCAPALGDMATASIPVMTISQRASSAISSSAPCTVDCGCKG